jgi:hypothetical protein
MNTLKGLSANETIFQRCGFSLKKGWCIAVMSAVGVQLALFVSGTQLYADNYFTWSYYRNIVLNTKSSGANVSSLVQNFPVLIRLTTADSMVFKNSQSNGADIRFANYRGAHLPYQIERWDNTDRKAELWVLVDSVKGSDSVNSTAYPNGYLQMYWGNSNAADSENAASVFSTSNGFAAVWHLQDTTEACGKLPLTGATKPTTKSSGIIDSAYNFNGTSQYFKTADSTLYAPSLNFAYNTPFTLSGWEYDNKATATYREIISKGGNNWHMGERTGGGRYEMLNTSASYGWIWDTTVTVPTTGAWHYITAVRSSTQGSAPSYADSLYIDGVLATGPVTPILNAGSTFVGTWAIYIGQEPDNTGYLWNGQLDEVEVSTVARSANWIKLCYQDQQANQTLVIKGPIQLQVPSLALPTNGAMNLPISLTMDWGSVPGAASYNVRVSTSSSFTSTVSNQTGLTMLSATVSGLANSTPYYWEVNATNGTVTGAWSSVWSFTTLGISAAPSLVSPTNGTTNQAISSTLSWSTVTAGASYNVQVSTSSGFTTTVLSQTGLTTLSATVSGLANAALYYWEVSATNASGTGSWSSVWSFTTVVSAPAAPTLSSPTSGPQPISGLTLSWASNSAGGPVTSYQLQVTTDASFTTTVYNWSSVLTTSQALPTLIGGISYYWEVGATGPGGGPVWAGPWTFTTLVAAPPASRRR